MITIFDLWVSGCKTNNSILHRLEGSGDTGLYETKTPYLQKNNYYYTSPVYHVWIKGKCLISTQNIHEAYELYNKGVTDGTS